MARPTTRLGVPIAVVIAAGLTTAALLPARPGYALEAMVKPLIEAKTARCQVVAQMKGQPAFNFTAMFRGSFDRQESREMGTINITDEAAGASLTLLPKEKTARILQAVNRDAKDRHPLASERGFLQTMREQILALQKDKRVKRESLGERKLADRTVAGYRVTAPGVQMDVWGDPETGMPHSIVSNIAAFPNLELTYSDFEFDVELDDELFSLTPPAGYTVTKDTIDVSKPAEKDFVEALRQFAKINGGVYPDEINMMEGMKTVGAYRRQLPDMSEEEREAEINRVRKMFARSFSFPLLAGEKADAAYAGQGVKPGDGDKPIFWYRPQGADTYRVIRADLTVIEAAKAPEVEGVQRFSPPAAASGK